VVDLVDEHVVADRGRVVLAFLGRIDLRVGLVAAPRGRLVIALGLTIKGEKITEIDVIADPCASAGSTWPSWPPDEVDRLLHAPVARPGAAAAGLPASSIRRIFWQSGLEVGYRASWRVAEGIRGSPH
jgi:hypothetical protein